MALRADDVDIARDRALVDRFQTGEVRAFEDIYERYYERLRRMCLRKVGDAHEAEEITQEVFARAFVAFPRLGGPRHVYAWLSVVASRLCVDTHRRRARTQPVSEVERVDITVDDDRVEVEVDLAHLRAALQRLTPRHREVLSFREQHGWTYQRIADHYGVSLGTVEALLFRARHALRREFAAIASGHRELAALPVIGVVFRRLAAWRERLDPWVSALSPLPYAELATIVALVTGVGMALGPGAGDSTSRTPITVAAGIATGAGMAALDNVADVVADEPAVGSGTAGATRASGPAEPSTDLAQPETMDFDAARRNAEAEPTHASTDQVAVGIDADEGAQATRAAAQAYAEQVQGWTERSLP